MKIAMLGHKRIPSREGGVEIVVEELAVRMAQMGHEVTVYNRKGEHVAGIYEDSKNRKKSFSYKGVEVKTAWTLPNKSLNAVVYSFFATIRAAMSQAEIVHFHAEGPCAMIPIAKIFGKKCIATIHGLDWKRAKWGGFATRFLLFGEKTAAKYADEVIVLSKDVQKYFKETYNRDTLLIFNGVNKPEHREPKIITMRYALKGNDYLLFLARLVPEKGVHTLLEAYRKSGVGLPLVIAGGVSHSSDYAAKIYAMSEEINREAEQLHTDQKVILTGFVQGTELEELYSNAGVYILPSEIEGLPLSLLEAMSYGNLCITSDIPENTDVIGAYGMSFPVGNVEALSTTLKEIADNMDVLRKQKTYGKEAIANFVLEKFNWEEVTKRTIECYESKK